MTRGVVYPVTDAPRRTRTRRDWRAVARGVGAVLTLCLSAVDHLAAALAGTRPIAWCARALGCALAEQYWRSRGVSDSVPDPAVIGGTVISHDDTEGAH